MKKEKGISGATMDAPADATRIANARLAIFHSEIDESGIAGARRRHADMAEDPAIAGRVALLALHARLRGKSSESVEELAHVIAEAPDTKAGAPASLAQAFLAAGRREEALAVIDAAPSTAARASLRLLAAGTNGDVRWDGDPRESNIYWWASAHLNRESERFHDHLGRAIRDAPWRLDWWFELADALLASHDVGRLLPRHWPELPHVPHHSRRWRLLATRASMLTTGRMGKALAHARIARAIAPDDWRTYAAEAQIIADFAALDHVATSFETYWSPDRSGTLRDAASNASVQAVTAARRAVTAAPTAADRVTAWNDLGAVHFASGAIDAAEEAFSHALLYDPRQRHATINRAVCLLVSGRDGELDRHMRETEFQTTLPPGLELIVERERLPGPSEGNGGASHPGPGIWERLPDHREWRRSVVFTQAWWRTLRG